MADNETPAQETSYQAAAKAMKESSAEPKSKTVLAQQCTVAIEACGKPESILQTMTETEKEALATLVDAHPTLSHMFLRSAEHFWVALRKRIESEAASK